MSIQDERPHMSESVDFDPDEGVVRTTRKIGKSGSSMVIRIPPQALQAASLEYQDQVELVADMNEKTITIRAVEDADDDSK